MSRIAPSSNNTVTVIEEITEPSQLVETQVTPVSAATEPPEVADDAVLEQEVANLHQRAFDLPVALFWNRMHYSFANLQEVNLYLESYEVDSSIVFPGRTVIQLQEELIVQPQGALATLGQMTVQANRIRVMARGRLLSRSSIQLNAASTDVSEGHVHAEGTIRLLGNQVLAVRAHIVSRTGDIIWLPQAEEESALFDATGAIIATRRRAQFGSAENVNAPLTLITDAARVLARRGEFYLGNVNNQHGLILIHGPILARGGTWNNRNGRIRSLSQLDFDVQSFQNQFGIAEATLDVNITTQELLDTQSGIISSTHRQLHLTSRNATIHAQRAILHGRTGAYIQGVSFALQRNGRRWTEQEVQSVLNGSELVLLDRYGNIVSSDTPVYRHQGIILVPHGRVEVTTLETLHNEGDTIASEEIVHISQNRNILVSRAGYSGNTRLVAGDSILGEYMRGRGGNLVMTARRNINIPKGKLKYLKHLLKVKKGIATISDSTLQGEILKIVTLHSMHANRVKIRMVKKALLKSLKANIKANNSNIEVESGPAAIKAPEGSVEHSGSTLKGKIAKIKAKNRSKVNQTTVVTEESTTITSGYTQAVDANITSTLGDVHVSASAYLNNTGGTNKAEKGKVAKSSQGLLVDRNTTNNAEEITRDAPKIVKEGVKDTATKKIADTATASLDVNNSTEKAPEVSHSSDGTLNVSNGSVKAEEITDRAVGRTFIENIDLEFRTYNNTSGSLEICDTIMSGQEMGCETTNGDMRLDNVAVDTERSTLNSQAQIALVNTDVSGDHTATSHGTQTQENVTYTSGTFTHESQHGNIDARNVDYIEATRVTNTASEGAIERDNYTIDSTESIEDSAQNVALRNGSEKTKRERKITSQTADLEQLEIQAREQIALYSQEHLRMLRSGFTTDSRFVSEANNLNAQEVLVTAQQGVASTAQNSNVRSSTLEGGSGDTTVTGTSSNSIADSALTGNNVLQTGENLHITNSTSIAQQENRSEGTTIHIDNALQVGQDVAHQATQSALLSSSTVQAHNSFHSDAPSNNLLDATIRATEQAAISGEDITENNVTMTSASITHTATGRLHQANSRYTSRQLASNALRLFKSKVQERGNSITHRAQEEITTLESTVRATENFEQRSSGSVANYDLTATAQQVQLRAEQENTASGLTIAAQTTGIAGNRTTISNSEVNSTTTTVASHNGQTVTNTTLTGDTALRNTYGMTDISHTTFHGDTTVHADSLLGLAVRQDNGALRTETESTYLPGLDAQATQVDMQSNRDLSLPEAHLVATENAELTADSIDLRNAQAHTQQKLKIDGGDVSAENLFATGNESNTIRSQRHTQLDHAQLGAAQGPLQVHTEGTSTLHNASVAAPTVHLHATQSTGAHDLHVETDNLQAQAEYLDLDRLQLDAQTAHLQGTQGVSTANSVKKVAQNYTATSQSGAIDESGAHNAIGQTANYTAQTALFHRDAVTQAQNMQLGTTILDNRSGFMQADQQTLHVSQFIDNAQGALSADQLTANSAFVNNQGGSITLTSDTNQTSTLNIQQLFSDEYSRIEGTGNLSINSSEWHQQQGTVNLEGIFRLVAPEITVYGEIMAQHVHADATRGNLTNRGTIIANIATLISALNLYNEQYIEAERLDMQAALRLINAENAHILAQDRATLKAWLVENFGEIGADAILEIEQEQTIRNIGNAWANALLKLTSTGGDIALEHALSNHGSIGLHSEQDIFVFHPVTTDGGIDASAENISIQNRVAAGRFSQFYARNNFEVVRTQAGFGGGFAVRARVFRNQAGEIDAVGNSSIDVDEFHNVGDREIPRSRRGLWGIFGRRSSGNTRNPYHVTPARIRLQGNLTVNARLKARNEGSDIFVSGNMRVMGNRLENINYTHTHVERIQCGKKRRLGRRSKKLYRNEYHTILDRAANLLVGGDLDLHLMQGMYNQGNIGARTLRLTLGDIYNGRSFADSGRQDSDPIATPQFAERRPFPPLPIFPERKAPTPVQPSIPSRMQQATLADGDCAFHALLGQSQNGAPLCAPQGRANFVRDLQARWGAGELSDRLYNDLQLQLTEMLTNPHPLFGRLERENPALWRSYQNTLWLHRNVSTSSEALQHSSVVRQVYLWLLSQSDYWLDQIELGIVAQLYDVSVDLYQPEQGTSGDNPYGRQTLHRSSDPNAAVIAVYYNGVDHFERLQAPVAEDAKKKPVRQEVTTTMPRADVAQQEAQLQQFRTETVQDPFNRFQAEMQVRNLVMNSFNTGDLINAGFITVQESMQVQVRNFIIERLYRDVYEDVKVRKSFGRSKIVQEHLRKLVDSGEIQVKVAEIIASHNFHNKGGRLYAEERIEIDADTIRNTAVTQDVLIKGRAGSKDKWCGGKNHSIGKEIESGEIVSGGDMVLHANSLIEQIGSKLLSIGDQVQIAKKIAHSSEHHTFVVERKKGWGSSVCKEGHASERSISASEMGSVRMFADTVHVSGSTVAAANTVQIVGEEEVAFTSRQIHMTIKTRRARAGLGVSSTSTERNDVHLEQPYVVGTNVVFLSPKGDIRAKGLEVHASEDLYVRACKDIVFTAEQVCYYVRTHGWSVAVSFFGSAALEALFSGSSGKTALGALLRESSFLSSLADLKGSKGAAGVAASSLTALLSGMQAYDTVKNILNGPQGIKNGLTDATGWTQSTTDPTTGQTQTKVNPAITVRVGTSKSEQMQEVSYPTNATAANATFISDKENIKFLGGTNVQAQDSIAVDAAKNFEMEAAHDRFSSSNKSAGVSVSFFSRGGGLISGGVDMARGSGSGVTHTPAKMHSDNIQIKAKDASLQGSQAHGNEEVRVTAQSLHVESLQNTAQSKQMSMSATVGVGSASGSYSSQRSNRSVVDDVCGITSGDRLEADIAGQTTIIGGMIASELGNMDFRSQKIEFRDLENSEKSSGFSIGAGASKNSNGTRDATGSVGFNKSSQKGVTRATLGGGNVVTESDISQLNRDTGRTQEMGKKREVRGKASGSLRAVEDLLDRAASVGNFFEALATKVPAKYKSAQERKLYRSLIAAGANAEVAQWIMDSAQHRQVISESGVPLEMVVAQAQYAMHAPIPAELEDNPQAIALYRAFVSLGCLPEEAQKYLTDTPQEAEPVDTSTPTPAAPPIQEEAPTSSSPPEEDNTPVFPAKEKSIPQTLAERINADLKRRGFNLRIQEASHTFMVSAPKEKESVLQSTSELITVQKEDSSDQKEDVGLVKRAWNLFVSLSRELGESVGRSDGTYETAEDIAASISRQYQASEETTDKAIGLAKDIFETGKKYAQAVGESEGRKNGTFDTPEELEASRLRQFDATVKGNEACGKLITETEVDLALFALGGYLGGSLSRSWRPLYKAMAIGGTSSMTAQGVKSLHQEIDYNLDLLAQGKEPEYGESTLRLIKETSLEGAIGSGIGTGFYGLGKIYRISKAGFSKMRDASAVASVSNKPTLIEQISEKTKAGAEKVKEAGKKLTDAVNNALDKIDPPMGGMQPAFSGGYSAPNASLANNRSVTDITRMEARAAKNGVGSSNIPKAIHPEAAKRVDPEALQKAEDFFAKSKLQKHPERAYELTKKHADGGFGTPMDLDNATAKKVLEYGTQHGDQVYNFFNKRIYIFQNNGHGKWHGYIAISSEDSINITVLRQWKSSGLISNSEYTKLCKSFGGGKSK